MSDKVGIRMSLATRMHGSTVEEVEYIDREEWDEMSEKERDKLIEELYEQFVCDNNYGGVEVIE